MNKKLALAAAAATVLPIAAPAAAMADEVAAPQMPSSVEQVPSLDAAFKTWNLGGAYVGGGAAMLVSSAVLGVPQIVTVLPCELIGQNSPAPCEYTGPSSLKLDSH